MRELSITLGEHAICSRHNLRLARYCLVVDGVQVAGLSGHAANQRSKTERSTHQRRTWVTIVGQDRWTAASSAVRLMDATLFSTTAHRANAHTHTTQHTHTALQTHTLYTRTYRNVELAGEPVCYVRPDSDCGQPTDPMLGCLGAWVFAAESVPPHHRRARTTSTPSARQIPLQASVTSRLARPARRATHPHPLSHHRKTSTAPATSCMAVTIRARAHPSRLAHAPRRPRRRRSSVRTESVSDLTEEMTRQQLRSSRRRRISRWSSLRRRPRKALTVAASTFRIMGTL